MYILDRTNLQELSHCCQYHQLIFECRKLPNGQDWVLTKIHFTNRIVGMVSQGYICRAGLHLREVRVASQKDELLHESYGGFGGVK